MYVFAYIPKMKIINKSKIVLIIPKKINKFFIHLNN